MEKLAPDAVESARIKSDPQAAGIIRMQRQDVTAGKPFHMRGFPVRPVPPDAGALSSNDQIALQVFAGGGDFLLLPRIRPSQIEFQIIAVPFFNHLGTTVQTEAPTPAGATGQKKINAGHAGDSGHRQWHRRTHGGEVYLVRSGENQTRFFGDERVIKAESAETIQLPFVIAGQLAVISAKPDRAGGILAGGAQPAFAAAVAEGNGGELIALQEQNPGRFRADPEIGFAVLKKINDTSAGQAGSVMFIEDLELQAVETHQAVERAEPEVTVVRLDNGNDLVGGEALVSPPSIHMKALRRRRLGRGAGARPQPQAKTGRHQPPREPPRVHPHGTMFEGDREHVKRIPGGATCDASSNH